MGKQEPTRSEDARAVIEGVKALDRYGFTTAARIAARAAEHIAAGRVDRAERATK